MIVRNNYGLRAGGAGHILIEYHADGGWSTSSMMLDGYADSHASVAMGALGM